MEATGSVSSDAAGRAGAAEASSTSEAATPRAASPRPATPPVRQATPRVVEQRRGPRVPALLLALIALGVGVAFGLLIARSRYKSQQLVASVNGVNITRDDFFRRMELASGPQMLQQMVKEEMVMQFARERSLAPTDAAVQARLDEVKKQPGYLDAMARTNETEDELRRALRVSMAQAAVLTHDSKVSDADVRRFYEANIDRSNPRALFYTPETVAVGVVITRTEADGKKALRDLNSGIPLKTVVHNYSIDKPTLATDGVLPKIERGRNLATTKEPALEEAIFALKIGERTGPRQFNGGWWIIQCLDKRAEVIQPFDRVKEACETQTKISKMDPAQAKKIEADYQAFRQKSSLQAFWKQYQPLLDATK